MKTLRQNHRQAVRIRAIIVSCFVATTFGHAHLSAAVVVNDGFETGDLSGWSSLGIVTVSTGFDYGAAGIVVPDTGTYAARLTTEGVDASVLASAMGITELALEATNGGVNATIGSLVYQTVSATAGDSFQFRWNFVEADYLPYDDWAFYGIRFEADPASVAMLASVNSVGPASGTTINGWQTQSVDITTSGNYTFYFGVVNGDDALGQSEFWIDGLSVSAIPEPGSSLALALLVGSGLLVRSRRK